MKISLLTKEIPRFARYDSWQDSRSSVYAGDSGINGDDFAITVVDDGSDVTDDDTVQWIVTLLINSDDADNVSITP